MASTSHKYQNVPQTDLDHDNDNDDNDGSTLNNKSSHKNIDYTDDDDIISDSTNYDQHNLEDLENPLDDVDDLDFEIDEDDLIDEDGNDIINEPFRLEQLQDKSNLKMAFMNMANSILGAGAIGCPLAIKNCGLIAGIIVIVLLTILVDFTIRLIVINLKLSGKKSYQDTVDHCFGKLGKIIIILTQALFAFGGCIGFCIIVGDTFPHILRAFFPNYINHSFLRFLFSRNVIIVLVTLGVSYPLSLSRDISNLAKASALALVSMGAIILIVLIHGPHLPNDLRGSLNISNILITPRVFQGISVISFAFVCHHNTSFIFHSLKDPSLNRFAKITHASCFVSMIALSLIGIGGFLIFKDKTKGNILNNFESDDFIVNIARACFGFNMLTTFPLEIFVLRDVLKDLYYVNRPSTLELSTKNHTILTTILVLITMSISLTTCNLGALFELIGATTASIMAYILPPMCNLKMTSSSKTRWQKVPYYGCIVFGFAVMFISSTQTIINSIHDTDEQHCIT
ncbi:hypothetical protein WICMUC_005491 [Wickerhamomyces mucosus]|uniref:Amino acid transporter transmembrane domain-containing protein n=1 Tax=Wickerhamomyces mucosus TaxID=1378264 RepID=A0A9P8P8K8_9ASCO|nr:hypothetical protein WICMUC_005491 [Wickerhamomyces mucosus]